MSSIHLCPCATDLRVRQRQRERDSDSRSCVVALSRCRVVTLRGQVPARLGTGSWVWGLVPVPSCVWSWTDHPPPCQCVYYLLSPHPPLWSREQRSAASNERSVRQSSGPTTRQLTQFPPQRSLSFCPASLSSITLAALLRIPTSHLVVYSTRPTTHRARCGGTGQGAY